MYYYPPQQKDNSTKKLLLAGVLASAVGVGGYFLLKSNNETTEIVQPPKKIVSPTKDPPKEKQELDVELPKYEVFNTAFDSGILLDQSTHGADFNIDKCATLCIEHSQCQYARFSESQKKCYLHRVTIIPDIGQEWVKKTSTSFRVFDDFVVYPKMQPEHPGQNPNMNNLEMKMIKYMTDVESIGECHKHCLSAKGENDEPCLVAVYDGKFKHCRLLQGHLGSEYKQIIIEDKKSF